MIGSKIPGGLNSDIKAQLSKSWGLGPPRADGILLLRTTMEPTEPLSSEAEAKVWLHSIVSLYAQRSGISLSAGGSSGGCVGAGGRCNN